MEPIHQLNTIYQGTALLCLYAIYMYSCMPDALQVLTLNYILYSAYCYMFVQWALPLILYAVYCYMFVPWALLLILYAVYCYMFVPWARLLILYAVYCRMFAPWALLLILYAVYCRMFVPRALPCILLHAVYCRELVLWALLLIVFAVSSHISFCHRHCLHCHYMLHVLAGLHQITCCIYAATCSLLMRTSAIHAILCSAWHYVYCHTIHYCEYWSDMKFSINLG